MCPEQQSYNRLIAGELSEDARRGLLAHLEACSRCREQFAGLQETWDLLGHWQVDPPTLSGLADEVLQLADAAQLESLRRLDWRQYLVRVAASVALAAGAGATAALLTRETAEPAIPAVTSDEQVVRSLGLEAMTGDSVLVLAEVFELSDSDSPPKERS